MSADQNKKLSMPLEALSEDSGLPGLKALPSISLLGEHNGILDDDLYEFLDQEVSRKQGK